MEKNKQDYDESSTKEQIEMFSEKNPNSLFRCAIHNSENSTATLQENIADGNENKKTINEERSTET
jgi:hypothetical protein